jgi:hypothetical protein
MASELNPEERIQLAIKALQDGTIPSQRQAALPIQHTQNHPPRQI